MALTYTNTVTTTFVLGGFPKTISNTYTASLSSSNYQTNGFTVDNTKMLLPVGTVGDIRQLTIKNLSTASISCSMNAASNSIAVIRPLSTFSIEPPPGVLTYYVTSSLAGADIEYIMLESN